MATKPDAEPKQELHDDVNQTKASQTDPAFDEADVIADDVSDQQDLEALDGIAAPVTDDPKQKTKKTSKVLPIVALLAVGGGAALVGGPKLAPHLPAGMAPVADFLSPGQASARDQIAALETKFDTRFGALENAPAPDLSTEISELSSNFTAQITGLSDQVNAADSGDIEARLTSVETQLSGVVASLETLTNQMAGVASGDASPELASYQSVIDGLRAEIATLSSKQGLIDQRIDEVAVNTDRRVEEADAKVDEVQETAEASISDIKLSKAMSDISGSLEAGTDFSSALTMLSDGGVVVPSALTDVASGVPTLAAVKAGFSGAAHAALKASIKSEANTGVTNKLMGFLKSQVTVRSLEPQEGDSTDAVLSRVQGALDDDNLAGALAQAVGLNEISKNAMADWLASATKRQSALDAVAALSGN